MRYKILALGDCNTSGDIKFENNSFVERFAKLVNLEPKNCGYTMSTVKEMLYFYDEYYHNDLDVIFIQYGLVDSWKTFKYSPYVLYYPNNFFRKIARKVVKKYKKIARKLGLNELFGEKFVVSAQEYEKNIEQVVKSSKNKKIFLIDTIPNRQLFRNEYIEQYNNILSQIADRYDNCYKVDVYKIFDNKFDDFYLDDTHLNDDGYDILTEKIYEVYKNC